METIKCKCCNNTKPISEFPIREYKKDNRPSYRHICKNCYNKRRQELKHGAVRISSPVIQVDNDNSYSNDTDILVNALLSLCRHEPQRLTACTKTDFLKATEYIGDFSFEEIKNIANEKLIKLGKQNPSFIEIQNNGNYLVIGDTFGKHTRTSIFNLIKNIIKECKIDTLICIGHNLDDDSEISNCFDHLHTRVIFIASKDELATLNEYKDKYGFEIVRNYIKIGDVIIRNQEKTTPYVSTAITNLDQRVYPRNCIVNCTRHEYSNRTCADGTDFIASPGTTANPFVKKTINKLLLTDGRKINMVYHESFHKYRKNAEDVGYWEKGCILIHKENSDVYVSMQRIKEIKENIYGIGLYNKCITSNGIINFNNEEKSYITALLSDLHIPHEYEDAIILANKITNKCCNNQVFVGDIIDNRSVNPHIKGTWESMQSDLLNEFVRYNTILSMFRNSSNGLIQIMKGNHENFMNRWLRNNNQFSNLIFAIENSINKNNCDDVIEDKQFIHVANETYIHHGDSDMYGSRGNNMEKTARTFRSQAVIGHTHSSAIRFGVYRLGCLCKLDQNYNEPNFSSWNHGMGILVPYENVDFILMINFKLNSNGNLSTWIAGDEKVIEISEKTKIENKQLNVRIA